MNTPLPSRQIIDSRIHTTTYADATPRILDWARAGESRYVIAANVHVVMEAHDQPDLQRIVNEADLATPDGMPLVWALRWLGQKGQPRVYGPELMLQVCRAAAQTGLVIGLYGSTPATLAALQDNLRQRFPTLTIGYAVAPPFGQPTPAEDETTVQAINAAGVRILLVGLGCPKQERWVGTHRGRVHAVMLAVGAAFDFHAGTLRQAPAWMQRAGLEWLFRLGMEPRRLLSRYLKHNPRFIALILAQLCRQRTPAASSSRRR